MGFSRRVGVLDLIENKPERNLYGKIMNANLAGIMPQAIAVWAEELGHQVFYATYTGAEDLASELPDDLDIVFISAFTHSAFLATALANRFRAEGVATALGGPHARSYPDDARLYFDYVLGVTNRDLIRDVLDDCSISRGAGQALDASRPPESIPGVRERWRFIETNHEKTRVLRIVPMLGSLGCPYTCSFCVDSTVRYQPLSYDQIREDLRFLARRSKRPVVGWYDPNFGVRFDEYLDLIEGAVRPGSIAFLAETTLSLLKEPNLKRLGHNGFWAVLPGVESWFECGEKSGQGRGLVGMDKVVALAEHMNLILRYIPYVQANFVLGLDCDHGRVPFELTKRFLDLAPGVFPAFSLFTAFGTSAPLFTRLQIADRVLRTPYALLDNNAGLNVRLKNYEPGEFYDGMIDLVRHAFSPRRVWRRLRNNKRGIVRWMNVLRAISSEGRGRLRYHRSVRAEMDNGGGLRPFLSGEDVDVPRFYRDRVKRDLGIYHDQLPAHVKRQLADGAWKGFPTSDAPAAAAG